MRLIFLLTCLSVLVQHGSVCAEEIDSIIVRYERELKNAKKNLDVLTNKIFLEVAQKAAGTQGCDENKLYNEFYSRFGGRPVSAFAKEITEENGFDLFSQSIDQSIYREFTFEEAPFLYLSIFGSTLRFDDVFLGVDKFTAFCEGRYRYFEQAYLNSEVTKDSGKGIEDEKVREVLSEGLRWEKGIKGAEASGILSWSDLMASYQGLRFWLHLTGKRSKTRSSPYFECKNEQWLLARPFKWSDYIDDSWDEWINCNTYKNESLSKKVRFLQAKLEKAYDRKYTCPVKPEKCKSLDGRYPEISHYVLSPKCSGKRSLEGEGGGKSSWEKMLNSWKHLRGG